ncbi:hypothetical protein A9Q89_11720 [Gammaproteobacteria bacterium 53_120_T64]|nr:hypothetical protein A9Q89_11720 [Gammaproteobacteria bacterium 53_120_T64]
MITSVTTASPSPIERIKNKLDHPVIDADCHVIEFTPVFLDYLKDTGGPEIAERFAKRQVNWYKMSGQERFDKQRTRTPLMTAVEVGPCTGINYQALIL